MIRRKWAIDPDSGQAVDFHKTRFFHGVCAIEFQSGDVVLSRGEFKQNLQIVLDELYKTSAPHPTEAWKVLAEMLEEVIYKPEYLKTMEKIRK